MRTASKAAAAAALAAAIAAATGIIKPWEGRSLTPYYDIVGVLTWCDGQTVGSPKPRYTHEECDAMLARSVALYEAQIRPCLPPDLPVQTRAAFVSTAYNIGTTAFCRSSMSRRALAGDLRGACDALMMWTKAGGRVVRGLVNRRTAERELCISGIKKGS
ncbi:lysozyme [Cereibacter azotoformans]|uniref:lysozyme n=1 Tax=Cereibacter azotoformans TaxID=43057 RepID=UPI000C6CB02B|nr:lysozyme [Cereibacter azotoformans]